MHRRFVVIRLIASSFLAIACSVYGSDLLRVDRNTDVSDASTGMLDAGADVSAGGSAGVPNAPDADAAGGVGGVGGVGGTGPETVTACLDAPEVDAESLGFSECPLCDDAFCVPTNLLSQVLSELPADFMPDCSDGESKCVPRSYIRSAGSVLLKRCTALGIVEGRCVNRCSPQVANQSGLRQDVCGPNELCAPCYLPTDGSPTGACDIGCDPGPTGPAFLFEPCCDGLGSCIPASLIPDQQIELLGPADCTAANQYCAPTELVISTNRPRVCSSLAGLEGRCIPLCVGLVAAQATLLPQDICVDGELCAPCYDPRTGLATGACTVNGDEPTSDPFAFAPCCDNEGLCVPEGAIPPDQVASLGRDTCTGPDEWCVPTDFTNGSFIPPECTSVAGAEGRCVSTCVQRVKEQATFLPKDSCADGELCAPCYDPTTGLSTGSCTFNNDTPTEPPVVFPSCCNDDGRCVPRNLVPTEQQAALDAGSCTGTDELCVPTDFIDPTFRPDTCRSIGDAEGRCIATCVGGVKGQADLLPTDGCAADEVCAPCYNPGDGSNTGACTVNGDSPTEPAVLFDECCESKGRCVPEQAVPEALRIGLEQETCSGDAASPTLCAPLSAILGETGEGPCAFEGAFNIPTPGPGACYDICTVPGLAALPQSDCASGQVCAPCFDADGQPTTLCDPSVTLPTAPDAGVDGGNPPDAGL